MGSTPSPGTMRCHQYTITSGRVTDKINAEVGTYSVGQRIVVDDAYWTVTAVSKKSFEIESPGGEMEDAQR